MKYWLCIVLILLLNCNSALADSLANRLQQYPAYEGKPTVEVAKGDLVYPEWIEGTWDVTSILVDQVAPLAPKIVTPGFENNRRHLNEEVKFQVRFKESSEAVLSRLPIPSLISGKLPVVSDRAFNGLKIAQAYLGDKNVLSVKVDPENPNRQVTFLAGDYQLISSVTGRGSETTGNEFIACEITQQIFKTKSQIYLNEVETTTGYELLADRIEANQITAIYLSPQDPNYFTAAGRPVALYRYKLILQKD